MRLKDWAQKEGIAYLTAWRWFKAGKLPYPAIKTPTGSILKVASGMNDQRLELIRLLNKLPRRIVVEHKDSLTRFGFNYFELLLAKLGCELVVIDRDREEKTDLMKDLIAIICSFSARIYGLRRGREKAKLAREVLCAEPA